MQSNNKQRSKSSKRTILVKICAALLVVAMVVPTILSAVLAII